MVATFVTMYKRTKLHEVRREGKEKRKKKRKEKEKEREKVKMSEFACNQYKRN